MNGHSDTFAAQLALQSYYMPVLGGMQELFKTDPDAPAPTLSLTFAAAAAARDRSMARAQGRAHAPVAGSNITGQAWS